MIQNELPPAQASELKFLRQQVDFWAEALLNTFDAPPGAGRQYWEAKSNLKKFVSDRRIEGFNI
jgi:hypothetical protein